MRRIRRWLAALSAAAMLAGCAQPAYWQAVEDFTPNGQVRVHVIDLYLGAAEPGMQGHAIRQQDGSCDIFIDRRAANPACIEAHERRHCAGEDHPNYRYNLACQ